jgi:tRNA 2-thiouridine synthesizing protein D
VFAYEGAVNLTMQAQQPHANPAKSTTVEEEQHPTTKDWIAALFALANGEQPLEWINCGLCVDERGAGEWIEGPKRGTPKDFLDWVQTSDAVLVIPTK